MRFYPSAKIVKVERNANRCTILLYAQITLSTIRQAASRQNKYQQAYLFCARFAVSLYFELINCV